jgi:hypothetical protein
MNGGIAQKSSGHSLHIGLAPVFFVVGIAGLAVMASVFSEDSNEIGVLLPIIVALGVAIFFYTTLWRRDGFVPVFDIGSFTMAAMLAYTIIPLAGIVAAKFYFSELSAQQLYQHLPSAEDIIPIAWRYVVYLATFAIAYLRVARNGISSTPLSRLAAKLYIRPFFLIAFLMLIAFTLFEQSTGVRLDKSYDRDLSANYALLKQLPMIVQQVVGRLYSIFFVIKLGIILCLMSLWSNRAARWTVITTLVFLIIDHILNLRARTELVLLLISVIFLYSQFVRRISMTMASALAVLLLGGFLLYGYVREAQTTSETMAMLQDPTNTTLLYSSANEFQCLFAGTYDLYRLLRQTNFALDVPWHAPLFELISVIPSQLLPFEKWDPQEWYLANYTIFPGYFMYNPICQSLTGFGWIELVLRGAIVGWLFGKLHQWYVRRAPEFWPTLFYLWMTVWSYYVIRGPSFGFLVQIVQVFIPAFIMVKFVSLFLPKGRN